MTYFNYLDGVECDEAPDYDWLIELFERQLSDEELGNHNLGIFDSDHEPDQAQLEVQLFGKVINGTFEIRHFLRYEFAAFVQNGEQNNGFLFRIFSVSNLEKRLLFFSKILGVDLKTNAEVTLKFATDDQSVWLEREYQNFLQLDADGEFNSVFSLNIELFFNCF